MLADKLPNKQTDIETNRQTAVKTAPPPPVAKGLYTVMHKHACAYYVITTNQIFNARSYVFSLEMKRFGEF